MMQTHANEGFEVPRGTRIRIWRPLAVWAAVTAGTLAAASAVPGSWSSIDSGSTYDDVLGLLVAACGTGLALALARLWVITTLTVTELVAGTPRARGGTTRRLVLLACGAAVVVGTGVPAMASGGDGHELLVGLRLPDRAVTSPQTHPARMATPTTPTTPTYVVRPGDSLWSIAEDHRDRSASVHERWQVIWQANRAVVGDDPDLIIPGQALRLPTSDTTHDQTTHDQTTHDQTSLDPNSDGDRR